MAQSDVYALYGAQCPLLPSQKSEQHLHHVVLVGWGAFVDHFRHQGRLFDLFRALFGGLSADSTGFVLEWFALTLSEDQLDDPGVVRGMEQLNQLLSKYRYGNSLKSRSTREIESVMHALHALVVYDERLFPPEATPPEAAPDAAEQAAR